jgi:hypothetical protein
VSSRAGFTAVALLTALALVATSAGAGLVLRPSFYTVRPDPRLCPSPLCGGYWVALANRARTTCADGLRRPRCYVAKVVDARGRPPAGLTAVGLATGRLRQETFDSAGTLGVLVVGEAFAALGRSTPAGRFARLSFTGVQCVRAPCFSIRETRLNSSFDQLVSGVDLAPAGLEPADRARAEAVLGEPGGLLAQGRVGAGIDGGRVFRATRVFLRAPRPRA